MSRQPAEEFAVGGQQPGQQVQGIARGVGVFAAKEEREGPGQHGLGGKARGLRLARLAWQGVADQGERLATGEFRHDVMVVGVEPLGHFHGRDVAGRILPAPGHAEIEVGRDGAAGMAVARRHHAEARGGVEHVVVEGKVADRHEVDAGLALDAPVAQAQVGGHGEEGVQGKRARPMGFQGGLEFPGKAHAGKSQGVRQHATTP